MKTKKVSFATLYVLQPLVKGFSVFYFVLLPVFYAERLITSKQLGLIGALYIVLLIFGAALVVRWFHRLSTRSLMLVSSLIVLGTSLLLLVGSWQNSVPIIVVSYGAMGLAIGIAMSGVNALAAHTTVRGDRFKSFARLSMATDTVRIVFPVSVAGTVAIGESRAAIGLIIASALAFLAMSGRIPASLHATLKTDQKVPSRVWHSKPFRFMMRLEFLDSFSSSQLFVFLPLLFLAKGYSLESSLTLQSAIFLGYLSGRWFVGVLARKYSGMRAIALAEVGMVVSIVLLLLAGQLWMLYGLSFALGVFARGTSPAIRALAFDSLEEGQVKQGSAAHVIAGDSGSAIGQLLFGFMVAWFGVKSPFVASAMVAVYIGLICFFRPVRIKTY